MGNQEMRPLVQFAPNDQIADLYGRLMVHWEPPQHYVRQDHYDAAVALVTEAEALIALLTTGILSAAAPLMAGHVNGDDAFACLAALATAAQQAAEAEARAAMLMAALDEYAVHAVGCDATMGAYTPCTCRLDQVRATGPGPLLVLGQRVAALLVVSDDLLDERGLSGRFVAAMEALNQTYQETPAWLRDYLQREAGDAEPR